MSNTVLRLFEIGQRNLTAADCAGIRLALEETGVEFTDEEEAGVRLRKH